MAGPRRIWILTAPAAIVLGLFLFVLARFWLAPTPALPSFAPTSAPRFREMSSLAEISPQAQPLRGRLVDPEGKPVAEALVYGRPHEVPTWSLSDAEGRFRLDWPRLPDTSEEPVSLAIAAWGFPAFQEEVTWQVAELEIVLPEREPVPPDLPQAVSAPLSGRCVPARAGDAPPFAWEIVLIPESPPDVFAATTVRRALCAPDGSFSFDDLSAGTYRAQVLPAWAAGGTWPDILGRELLFDHDPEEPTDLQLELAEGALSGTLKDRRDRTIEGALLLLSDASQPGHLWPPATTDTRGRFLFEDLPAGNYLLFIEAGNARLKDVPVEVLAGRSIEVEVPPLGLR